MIGTYLYCVRGSSLYNKILEESVASNPFMHLIVLNINEYEGKEKGMKIGKRETKTRFIIEGRTFFSSNGIIL